MIHVHIIFNHRHKVVNLAGEELVMDTEAAFSPTLGEGGRLVRAPDVSGEIYRLEILPKGDYKTAVNLFSVDELRRMNVTRDLEACEVIILCQFSLHRSTRNRVNVQIS